MGKVFSHRLRRHCRRIGRPGRVLIVGLSVIGLLGLAFVRCRPVMTAFAESQAVWTATKIANQIAARVLTEHESVCRDVVAVTYDDQQRVSCIRADTAAINAVRTEMTDAVIGAMEEVSALSVSVSIGTLLGWHWVSGFGPLVSFPISFTATVLSDATSSLEAVGINQSVFCVRIHLDVSLYVVTPGGRSTVSTRVSYPMAETVLLGEVPDNLTEVYGDDQSLLGQIFDYGTTQ